ncbi:efflux RND transporter periplasmic adaptor subunit [Dickeya oryzae]|uniref:efflux RND transporter periplasmic adaptor subunit n=1 Tax=Dickeya oryzae TaxID=1240404 RepID=UPI001AEC9EF0|nr:efflux RND transporter periplasmic adaptor subunit [Dickeya oryzae]MBP2848408.1 efflux RND transporter periplasmic adaptor subunit [Dickeya oryzae]
MNRQQWFLIGPLAIVLASIAGCDDKAAVNPSPRYVLSATALKESAGGMSLAGTVQPRVTSALSFQTPGRVVSRHVEVGDEVKAGQVLARLDPLALAFAVQSAQASVQDAQAKLQNAVITAKRQRSLAAVNVTSVENLEEAEQSLTAAQAAVDVAQARLRKASEQLSYAELKAHFDGVITSVSVETGQTVAAGQTVLQIAYLGERDAVVDLPESQLKDVTLGHRFEVALQMDPAVKWTGELREIAPAADAATRMRRVKIAINDAPEAFRLGTVVTVSPLMARNTDKPLIVPATAILERQQAHFVWVINPSSLTVSLREIQLMPASQGDSVRVLGGLQEGEQIVIAGVNSLQPGQKIRIERTSTL